MRRPPGANSSTPRGEGDKTCLKPCPAADGPHGRWAAPQVGSAAQSRRWSRTPRPFRASSPKARRASAATQLRIEMLKYRASIDILRHQRDRAGADARGDRRLYTKRNAELIKTANIKRD